MHSKADAGEALTHFVQDIGIPAAVVVDGAGEQTGRNSTFVKTCNFLQS